MKRVVISYCINFIFPEYLLLSGPSSNCYTHTHTIYNVVYYMYIKYILLILNNDGQSESKDFVNTSTPSGILLFNIITIIIV